ncbi:protein of unknown function [endosymbiont DhMRE of Dentiscutata heterogama]|uniref:hypothetical protein n=1 Tax=endosymbiont DhMRE of Dentiscutata heterogama TaxID=1609546 RepID=UPI000629DCB5|nr:hypothetical protein [endosymbiont DhMRE of Dentiscutata heterogama]CFW92840.1 protein of unknown function [endosymbiont DhMRE of Dentiscutata heterogama]
MVKSSEVLKDLSKWSYNGSIKGKEGHFNLVFWGEGENNNKVIEPEEKWEKYEEIAKGFFKEIKQNPQDWQLKEAPNSDPYFDCYLIEHKSGRKHYTPKHGIWGFGDLREEWDEVLSVLKGEKKDKPQDNPPQDNPPTNPSLPQKQPFYQSKTFWFLVVGIVVVISTFLYTKLSRKE